MIFGMPLVAEAAPYVVETGNGSVFDTAGVSVSNMLIGYEIPESPIDGNYYAGTGINQTNFTINSAGPIVVSDLLSIAEGYVLGLENTLGTPVNISLNDVVAVGNLTIQDADLLEISGSLTVENGLSIYANTVNSGAINITGGNTTINVNDVLTIALLTNKGTGNVNIQADSIVSSGTIQNIEGASNFYMLSGGNISSSGSIENSGALMEIGRIVDDDVVNISLTGTATIKNDSNFGTMNIYADSLSVAGGSSADASFINSGNLYAVITNETNLAYGFNLNGMETDNTFHLDTGTLVLGDGNSDDLWQQISENNLNEFYLAIRNGSLTLNNILNGQNNSSANMTLIANSIIANSVTNNATGTGAELSISTITGSGGAINVSGIISSIDGSNTSIDADGNLIVVGNVSNNGNMSLSGATVQLQGVSNGNGNLEIISSTSESGLIAINGDVSNNNGTITINSNDVSISGLLINNGGTTSIYASDTSGSKLQMGSLDVNGGNVNLNALIGSISLSGSLNVSGGVLNIGQATKSLIVDQSIDIDGNIVLSGYNSNESGNVNIAAYGSPNFSLTSTNGAINLGGIIATDNKNSRSIVLSADNIFVNQNVDVSGLSEVVFGTSNLQNLKVAGDVVANNGGTVEFVTGSTTVGSLTNFGTTNGQIIAKGNQIIATDGLIDLVGGVWFNGDSPTTGLIVNGTNTLTLQTNNSEIDLSGGVSIASGNTFIVNSGTSVSLSGLIVNGGTLDIDSNTFVEFDNKITNSGILSVNTNLINGSDIINNSSATLISSGNMILGDVTNSDDLVLNGAAITTGTIDVSGGVMDILGNSLSANFVTVTSGTLNVNVNSIATENDITITGNLVQGAETGSFNLTNDNFILNSDGDLNINGMFSANAGNATYHFDGIATVEGEINVANTANVNFTATSISAQDLNNSGTLALVANDGISLGVISNTGNLTLDSGEAFLEVSNLSTGNAGIIVLSGLGLGANGAFSVNGSLYQNYNDSLGAGDVNILSNDYTITANNFNVTSDINQISETMIVNSSDIDVGGSIQAVNLKFYANPSNNWMNVNVKNSVSGGVGFIGIEQMTIGGNYIFNNDSSLNVAVLPYAAGPSINSTTRNYWSTVSLNADNTLGIITNPDDAEAMISVGGEFISDVSGFGEHSNNSSLQDGQIGINLFDIVNQGTAIWLVHADEGIVELSDKIRNLNVNFCNADGSICFNYLDSLNTNNGTSTDLPAYLSMRDTDGDGLEDSIYVVFDPRFGGPVEVFDIQPIVAQSDGHTEGDFVSAGALDNLIFGQLLNKGFFYDTPIEAIPVIFQGTNLYEMAQELYNRMEYYYLNHDVNIFTGFSRLFQVRELEQIASSIILNEHTNYRSFEDHMFDEFVWNRNRNLKKSWLDVDFGMFNQKESDNNSVDGNRFNIAGGFDWQYSDTMILGLTGHISNTSSEFSDTIDLSYKPNEVMIGSVKTDVSDTNIGFGGYLMKILGEKTRIYGNAFLDAHLLDVSRNQLLVGDIDGSGTSFSLISEWGLLHDWLNHYVVGNLYARIGYNFGFSVKEKADNQDYMNLKSDGYMILTPGYSLMAQKRIYPSAWLQIRPYASIGLEYDVLGAPDSVKYKFALAHSYTDYDIDVNPLWANIGGGIEVLSANGIQIGMDYRYQYNSAIQLHNIKVSGSYRF